MFLTGFPYTCFNRNRKVTVIQGCQLVNNLTEYLLQTSPSSFMKSFFSNPSLLKTLHKYETGL